MRFLKVALKHQKSNQIKSFVTKSENTDTDKHRCLITILRLSSFIRGFKREQLTKHFCRYDSVFTYIFIMYFINRKAGILNNYVNVERNTIL